MLIASMVMAVALGVTYWTGGQTQLEGLFAGLSLAFLGIGLALWARYLLPHGPYVEKRPPLGEGEAETDALVSDLEREGEMARRPVLIRLVILAGVALTGALASSLRSLGPKPGTAALHTPWRTRRRAVTADGRPVLAAEVPLDGLVTIFPEHDTGGAQGQAVLIRVPSDQLELPHGRAGWAPDGLIAYSKICTHAGCPVGLYQSDSHTLLCPCHQSVFDVLSGANPVTGPAAWPLPQLPIEIDDQGVVRSTGDFSSPVGPGWWKEGP